VGINPLMPTEPESVTVSEVVHRAVEVCEDSTSESLDELLEKFEDDDRPISAVEDAEEMLNERIGPPDFDDLDAALTMARAVIVYLAHRRDELEGGRLELLRLAARAEFDGRPPDHVKQWLTEQGVSL
jgi:hypothetical protein